MLPQRLPWARASVAGALVLVAVAGSARAQSRNDPREAPEIRALVFEGVNSVERRELERSIQTQASECKNILLTVFCMFSKAPTWVDKSYLDRRELARDMLRIRGFYWKRGYREAAVDTTIIREDDRAVRVVFHIDEGRPTLVRRLTVDYDPSLLDERGVQRNARLRAGQPYDIDRLDSTRVNYVNMMWNLGYSDAVVDTVTMVDDSVAYVADVRIRVIPNHRTIVGSIAVIGLNRVDRQTVINSLALAPGGLFRRGDLLESQRNLYESNLFRLVAITVPDTGPPATRDSIKRVEVRVSESPLREVRVGAGLTSIDFMQAQGGMTNYNIFGGARRLDLNGSLGNLLAPQLAGKGFFYDPGSIVSGGEAGRYAAPTWSLSADFRQPAFLRRPRDQAGFSAFAHRRASPGIFVDNGYGGAATFTRHVRLRAPASLSYRFEISRVEASDVYFCVNYGVCDTLTIGALRRHQPLAPFQLTGFVDRSDVPLNPTRGYTARVDIEHASSFTASRYRYNRGYLDAAAYTHRGSNVFAARLRVGMVRSLGTGLGSLGVLHPRKRFYSGGSSSVRGYAENQLGPRLLTIDPERLAVSVEDGGAGCTIEPEAIVDCDPNSGSVRNRDFRPQALGGTSVLEGSIEWRFPLRIHRKLEGAIFIDGGVVGESALRTVDDIQAIARGSAALTPGIGARYLSPVGPIRFDIGFNPKLTEYLPVVTEVFANGERKLVPLSIPRRWAPTGPTLLDRLTLHLSIGQAY